MPRFTGTAGTNARTGRDKKIRAHITGLQAFGLTVTITGDEQAA